MNDKPEIPDPPAGPGLFGVPTHLLERYREQSAADPMVVAAIDAELERRAT